MSRRLSRPCWDKPHRCPGWAGGGWRYARVTRCMNGYVSTSVRDPLDSSELLDVRAAKWHPGYCNQCNVMTIPWALRWLDPRYWRHAF